MELLDGLGELSKAYPILNYLVVIVVATILTKQELKKRHKKADENRKADLEYRASHEVADMAFRANQARQMEEMTGAIKTLSDTMNRNMEKTDSRFEQLARERLADQQETNKKFIEVGNKLVFLETYLQLGAQKPEENLTAPVPRLDSNLQQPQGDKDV